MGILANHVPSIEALRPGVVEVVESGNASKKFFSEFRRDMGTHNETNATIVSGGFATVHPNNKLTVNVVEAAPLDAFSPEVSYMLAKSPFNISSLLVHSHRLSDQISRKL